MDDRRFKFRHRTLKPGKIAFGHGAAIDCIVRNLSHGGACLEVAGPVGIPDTFDLVMDHNRSIRPCRVAWRTEKQLGVSFT